jgi:hypothetical protein
MKMILGIAAALIVGYLVWRWFAPAPSRPSVAHTPTQRASPRPRPAARSTPSKRPAAQERANKPTPARSTVAKQPRLAPEGTYFLLQRVSLKTDSGVIGFAPGTKVTLVDQGTSMSTVSDGEYQFMVASSQLTNDLDMAENVTKSDYTAQAQIAESIGRSVRQYEQQQLDAILATEKEKGQKKTGHKNPRRSPSPKPKP